MLAVGDGVLVFGGLLGALPAFVAVHRLASRRISASVRVAPIDRWKCDSLVSPSVVHVMIMIISGCMISVELIFSMVMADVPDCITPISSMGII